MRDRKLYSSPQAYLNRFFKGPKRFKFEISFENSYENEEWRIEWIDDENFLLQISLPDTSGFPSWHDIFIRPLVECVEYMRKAAK